MRYLARLAVRSFLLALVAGLLATSCSSDDNKSTPKGVAPGAPVSAAPASAASDSGFPRPDEGAVLDATRRFVEQVTTYDHTKLDAQLNAVLPLTIDPLRGQLQKSLTGDFANTTRDAARDSTGKAVELGLTSLNGNRAVAVAFVDQQLTSPGGNSTQRLRQRVTLTQVKGAWLASKLENL